MDGSSNLTKGTDHESVQSKWAYDFGSKDMLELIKQWSAMIKKGDRMGIY
jgi:hypothetical protein